MQDVLANHGNRDTRGQILTLVDRMSEDMQVKLLQYLKSALPTDIKGDLIGNKRFETRRHCLVGVTYQAGDASHSGFILDMSAFGVFIESDRPFAVGRQIALSFTLPRLGTFSRIQAIIVWSGSHGFGAKFMALTPRQEVQIKSFSEEASRTYTILS